MPTRRHSAHHRRGPCHRQLCAIDFAPRVWSALDVEILTELAASALREIKLRSAVRDAERHARAAQDAVRSREEVLAVVAHDLRTPLNFIKMGAQLVAEAPDAKENAQLLERVQGAVDLMNLLIDDLLEVAKIEAGGISVHPKPLSPQTLIDDAIKMSEPLALRHQIKLIAQWEPGLPLVLADYERILRVFSNLIVNAVKFSGASADVRVTATRGDGTVRFSVIDSGPGISPENLERIFDRFWQADTADRRGAGLGLAIVKAIVTAHGGTIGVTSIVGHGSNFYFDLPAACAAALNNFRRFQRRSLNLSIHRVSEPLREIHCSSLSDRAHIALCGRPERRARHVAEIAERSAAARACRDQNPPLGWREQQTETIRQRFVGHGGERHRGD